MNDPRDPRDLRPREQQRMRDLLDDATSDVHPQQGLDAIRSRLEERPVNARPWFLGTAAAVLATAATVTAVAMTGNLGGTPDPGRDAGPAAGPSSTAETPEAPTSPEPDDPSPSSTPQPVESAVPVYYVGDTGQGPRLYREFHAGTGDDPLRQALTEALGRAPDDPDYRTSWPAGSGVDANFLPEEEDATINVVLFSPEGTSLRDRPAGMSRQEAATAVQQLVYTAQAVTQTTTPVRFGVDKARTDRLLGVPIDELVTRAAEADVLAQVWIIDPAEGTTVRDGFEVSGLGNFFEANVVWELHRGDEDGPVVASNADDPVMAERAMEMAPYSFTVDLPDDAEPGTYTLVVRDEDVSNGEGFPPFRDTKQLTVTD